MKDDSAIPTEVIAAPQPPPEQPLLAAMAMTDAVMELDASQSSAARKPTSLEVVEGEMARYEVTPYDADEDDDWIVWWWNCRDTMPTLYPFALKFLSLQAGSTSAERLFSKSGALISKTRTRMDTSMACAQLKLYYNHPKSVALREEEKCAAARKRKSGFGTDEDSAPKRSAQPAVVVDGEDDEEMGGDE